MPRNEGITFHNVGTLHDKTLCNIYDSNGRCGMNVVNPWCVQVRITAC